jgi:hypothetical protein
MLSSQKVLPNSELESLVSPLIYQQRQLNPNQTHHSTQKSWCYWHGEC